MHCCGALYGHPFLNIVVRRFFFRYNFAGTIVLGEHSKRPWGKLDKKRVRRGFDTVLPKLIYERAKFVNEGKNQDDQAWEDLCEKSFPEHIKLSPGLFLLTCACANKTVYGYSFMTKNYFWNWSNTFFKGLQAHHSVFLNGV